MPGSVERRTTTVAVDELGAVVQAAASAGWPSSHVAAAELVAVTGSDVPAGAMGDRKPSYGEPRATGGSMSLRCDDGSLLAATARVHEDARAIADRPYPLFVRLEDGSYVAG